MNNHRLNVNDLFDKIKKKYKIKARNSFLSISMINKKDDEIQNFRRISPKKIIYKKHQYRFKDIKNLIIPKVELKKYIKIGKRTITYDNSKNINYYFHINQVLLNIRERKKAVRKINSQKIYKKKQKAKIYKNTEEDIFGNKKNKKIKDSFSLLDSSKRSSKIIEEKKEKKKEEKMKEEIKKEEIIKPQIEEKKEEKKNNLSEKIKKLNNKFKKKKKTMPLIQQKKSIVKKKTFNSLNRSKFFQKKGTSTTTIYSNRINPKKIKSNLKSPAINSILKDIRDLSQSILTNRIKKNSDKKNRTIFYDKHFGYEYWKENELRKCLCYHSNSNKKNKSFRINFSPNKDPETFSQISSNFSWLFSKNNFDDIPDYETDFSFGNKNKSLNPYSINWTKNMIQNNYNMKIKMKNNNFGMPKIELIRVQSAIPYKDKEKIIYNNSKNKNEFYKKNNNMFGRIYKKNEVEFPVIKYF